MRRLIEIKVGEIVELDNELYICVEDDPHSLCSECAFYDTDYCCNIACIDADREDETDVHFVKQEGGRD